MYFISVLADDNMWLLMCALDMH